MNSEVKTSIPKLKVPAWLDQAAGVLRVEFECPVQLLQSEALDIHGLAVDLDRGQVLMLEQSGIWSPLPRG